MNDNLKIKKNILEILPSIEECELFNKSTTCFASLCITEIEVAIKEKYDNKIRTNISFEVNGENNFRCVLSLGFEHFKNSWFHFISFDKKIDENFPIKIFAFTNKKSFGNAKNNEHLEDILTEILKNKKTEIMILSNLVQ